MSSTASTLTHLHLEAQLQFYDAALVPDGPPVIVWNFNSLSGGWLFEFRQLLSGDMIVAVRPPGLGGPSKQGQLVTEDGVVLGAPISYGSSFAAPNYVTIPATGEVFHTTFGRLNEQMFYNAVAGTVGIFVTLHHVSQELTGTTDADVLNGSAIADTLAADSGADTLNGGAGDDTLIGGFDSDADQFSGGAGNDTMLEGRAGDMMTGGDGNDLYQLQALSRSDPMATIVETANGGIDTVTSHVDYNLPDNVENFMLLGRFFTSTEDAEYGVGNTLANLIVGNEVGNVLVGRDGNDTLIGEGGADILSGDDGDDELSGGAGADIMYGGQGADTYYINDAGDQALDSGWIGNDRVFATSNFTSAGGMEFISAMASGLTLTGDSTGNVMTAHSGGSALNGLGGVDVLVGGVGADTLNGGDDNDVIQGGASDDSLLGGTGNDDLDGGAGNDTMAGGAGNDFYHVGSLTDVIVELAGEGVDTVISSVDLSLLQRGNHVEAATLAEGGATILGGDDRANILSGNANDNLLVGEGGDDILSGGGGNDRIMGGVGVDTLTGGAGNDRFWIIGSNAGVDAICDFTAGDLIELTAAAFGFSPGGGLVAGANFIANANPTAAQSGATALYDTDAGILSWDSDGTGGAAAVQIAVFWSLPTLNASDFIFT